MKSKTNKSEQIRALIDEGLDNNQIRRRLKVSYQLVYIVRRNYTNEKPRTEILKNNPLVKELLISIKSIERALQIATRIER